MINNFPIFKSSRESHERAPTGRTISKYHDNLICQYQYKQFVNDPSSNINALFSLICITYGILHYDVHSTSNSWVQLFLLQMRT